MEKQCRILIVNDAREECLFYQKILAQAPRYSYQVKEASSGRRALLRCREQMPDLILLSDRLPDTTALEFMHQLRQVSDRQQLPVIILAHQDDEEMAGQLLDAGAQDYLCLDCGVELWHHAIHNTLRRMPALQAWEQGIKNNLKNAGVTLGGALHQNLEDLLQDITTLPPTQGALEQERSLLSSLLNSIPDLIFYKSKLGVYLLCNQAFAEFVGRPQTEIIGLQDWDLFSQSSATVLQARDQEVLTTGLAQKYEEWATYQDGHRRCLDTLKIPVKDSHNQVLGLIGICRDITDRTQVMVELEAANAEMQALFSAMNDLVLVLDSEGRYLKIPASNSKRIFKSTEECLGKTLHELFPQHTADQFFYYIRQCLSQQRTLEVEYKLEINGEEVWSIASISPLSLDQVIWVARDITERKEIEQALAQEIRIRARAERDLQLANEALRASEVRFHAFMHNNPAVCFIQDRGGKILYTNRIGEQLVGIPLKKLQRMTHHHFLPAELAQQVDAYHHQILISGQTVEFTTALRDNQGKLRDWLIFQFPIPIATGQPLIGGIAVEITERKQAEETVRQLNESLYYQATQLKATNRELKAFSYSVSHDLRAPLRSINGFSQILLSHHASHLPAVAQEYLIRIQAAAQRMYNLIDDMLTLSRISQSEMHRQQVNLTSIVQDIVTELQQTMPDRQVDFKIRPNLMTTGDFRLLRIALDNLLRNAWKFTSKVAQSQIEFGAVYLNNSGSEIITDKTIPIYYVRDNGAGFDMAYAEKLFVPFQRLHSQEEFEGTGIGLAIAHRVIHRHGGHIWAESQVNQGTTFYFTIEPDRLNVS